MDPPTLRKMLNKYEEESNTIKIKIQVLKEYLEKTKLEETKVADAASAADFNQFLGDRVRITETSEPVTLNDIWRAYRCWYDKKGKGKKLTQIYLLTELEKIFGKPLDSNYYTRMLVFDTSEDVEIYDSKFQKT